MYQETSLAKQGLKEEFKTLLGQVLGNPNTAWSLHLQGMSMIKTVSYATLTVQDWKKIIWDHCWMEAGDLVTDTYKAEVITGGIPLACMTSHSRSNYFSEFPNVQKSTKLKFLSLSQVLQHKWMAYFQSRKEVFNNTHHPGRSNTVIPPDTHTPQKAILNDCTFNTVHLWSV